jgi:hypothetical protein
MNTSNVATARKIVNIILITEQQLQQDMWSNLFQCCEKYEYDNGPKSWICTFQISEISLFPGSILVIQ